MVEEETLVADTVTALLKRTGSASVGIIDAGDGDESGLEQERHALAVSGFSVAHDGQRTINVAAYFFNGFTATSLKKTTSCSPWFCSPIYPSSGRGPRSGSKANFFGGTGWPSV